MMRLTNKAVNSDEYFSKNVKEYCRVLAAHADSAQYLLHAVCCRVRAIEHRLSLKIRLYFRSR